MERLESLGPERDDAILLLYIPHDDVYIWWVAQAEKWDHWCLGSGDQDWGIHVRGFKLGASGTACYVPKRDELSAARVSVDHLNGFIVYVVTRLRLC